MINDQTIKDQTIIANQFNNYFCVIGAKLAEKIIQTNLRPNDFLVNRVSDTIFLDLPYTNEVFAQILSLKDKAHGYIPAFFLKLPNL